jgi:FkbM family methyltransferase
MVSERWAILKRVIMSSTSEAPPDLLLRSGTGDTGIWKMVFTNNEYQVMDLSGRYVVDIGANIGAFSCLASERGAAKVVCLEPFESNFRVLTHNSNLYQNIVPLKLAISDRDGETLSLCTEEEYIEEFRTIFPERAVVEMGGVHVDSVEARRGSDSCQTITLETLMIQQSLDRIDVLKIDCEGGEWKIFAHTPDDVFERVGEMVGEYHLGPETVREVLGSDVDALDWLREFFSRNGFDSALRGNLNNKLVGWFYARKRGLISSAINDSWFRSLGD